MRANTGRYLTEKPVKWEETGGAKMVVGLLSQAPSFEHFYQQLTKHIEIKSLPKIANNFINDSSQLYSTKAIPRIDYLTIITNQYLRTLNALKTFLLTNEIIGNYAHCNSQLEYIFNEIQNEQIIIKSQYIYTDKQLLKFVDSISRCIYPAIADLRRPWCWDYIRDEAIESHLSNSI